LKNIDVVVPIFNEEEIVEELVLRLQKVTQGLIYSFKFIVVDDGSKDKSLEKLLSIQADEPRLEIIKLSRNWGHQNAYNAGVDRSAGDALILMDGDLEDPPELFPQFIEKWEKGSEVVYAVKESRQRTGLERFMFSLFYKLLERFSEVRVDQQAGMFSLIDRKVVNELKRCSEKNKYYVGLRFFMGFKQSRINYHREKRFSGKPKQTFRRLLNYGLNAFFSFSFLPIRLLTYLGFFLLLVILIIGFVFILGHTTSIPHWFFDQIRGLPGWTSIMLAVFFVLGVQIIFLGILGEYIARIFDEVRSRPYYVVDQIYEVDSDN
jgi:glycosyltransferase involved in cell wall biosynthesis